MYYNQQPVPHSKKRKANSGSRARPHQIVLQRHPLERVETEDSLQVSAEVLDINIAPFKFD